MFAQFAQGGCGDTALAARRYFFRQKLHCAVHPYGKDFVDAFKVGVCAAAIRCAGRVLEIGAIAADVGPDHDAVLGVGPDFTGQGQQHHATLEVEFFRLPILRDRLAWWFRHFFGLCAALDVGAKATFEHADLVAVILAQQFAIWRNCRGLGLGVGRAEGAGVAAFGVVRTANECATRTGCAHAQTAQSAVGAEARIGTFLVRREEVGCQHIVDFFKHFGNPQL